MASSGASALKRAKRVMEEAADALRVYEIPPPSRLLTGGRYEYGAEDYIPRDTTLDNAGIAFHHWLATIPDEQKLCRYWSAFKQADIFAPGRWRPAREPGKKRRPLQCLNSRHLLQSIRTNDIAVILAPRGDAYSDMINVSEIDSPIGRFRDSVSVTGMVQDALEISTRNDPGGACATYCGLVYNYLEAERAVYELSAPRPIPPNHNPHAGLSG